MEPDKVEYNVDVAVAEESCVGDGHVTLHVEKVAPWATVRWNGQQVTTGFTAIPSSVLAVEVPVPGIRAGESLDPDQLASLLQQVMMIVIPSCRVFVQQAEAEFNVKEDEF